VHTTSKPNMLPGLPLLESTPDILDLLLRAAPEDAFAWQPAPDRWSIRDILAHLAEVEYHVMRARARRMVEEDAPVLEPYDQNAAYLAGRYAMQDARTSLERFRREREASVTWLRTLPPAVVEHIGKHQDLGVITFGQLMHEWAFHDVGHLRQIAEVLRAKAFWPQMGAFQRYYNINP
jgi:DinB family protein